MSFPRSQFHYVVHHDDHELDPQSHKRWRLAFTVIFASRVFISLAAEAAAKKQQQINQWLNGSRRMHSFTAVDIDNNKTTTIDLDQLSKVDHKSLVNIVRSKNLNRLNQLFGGVDKVAKALQTGIKNGITTGASDELPRRERFGSNAYKTPPPKGFFAFVLEAFEDTIILILLACAALSIAFGVKEFGWREGWYDGGSIIVAVILVVSVSAISNFRQSKRFTELAALRSNIQVEVLRDQGRRQHVSIYDVVVGDIVCLKIGDQIPADGLLVNGSEAAVVMVDESSMTGESEHVEVNRKENPFLVSGGKVVDGFGLMVVTAVGQDTAWGEMMSSIGSGESGEKTPLQVRLDGLTSYIGRVGLAVAFLVLVVLLVRYFTGNMKDLKENQKFIPGKTKFAGVMAVVVRIIADAVTIIVVAIPEGLPLAVTLTLAYSMKRMLADQAMVRKLSACETMGSATVICTDKTGTLTLNQMKVTEFWLGDEEAIDLRDTNNVKDALGQEILELFYQGVGLNTTGSVYIPAEVSSVSSGIEFSGSPTEIAILSWAVLDLGMNIEEIKKNYVVLHVESFSSGKKRSGILMRKKNDESVVYVHWKGAAEMVLAMCASYIHTSGVTKVIGESEKKRFDQIIEGMAANSLRCIAFAYKQMEAEEKEATGNTDNKQLKEDGLTLLGIVGLKDPCRPGVETAVKTCKDAGVHVKMITGDNIFTARSIAIECGILNPDMDLNTEAVVLGEEFRNYTPEERKSKIEKIRVMARSSPLDKLLMVQSLKQKGHVVAVTGDGTNDAPALKEADVGLAMGIQGTEVAKQSSDIIILDDNFASIVTVLTWGRSVYSNIQKFIQFQLTVNVAALVINFIAAVSAGEVPLTAVQLLWVNLIMDTLGALALATERPTKELLAQPPVGRTAPLITNVMWRNLIAQSMYQIAVLLILQYKGKVIFEVNEMVKDTLIFNTFVLCQAFNEFNARKLEKKNVFKGIHKNKLFLGIIGITIVLQVVMVEFLNRFADTKRLNWGQWGACIGMAIITWPIGWLAKLIPVPEKPVFSMLKQPRS